MLEPLLMCTLCVSFCEMVDNISHIDTHYVCYIKFVQRLERRVGALQISTIIITSYISSHAGSPLISTPGCTGPIQPYTINISSHAGSPLVLHHTPVSCIHLQRISSTQQ